MKFKFNIKNYNKKHRHQRERARWRVELQSRVEFQRSSTTKSVTHGNFIILNAIMLYNYQVKYMNFYH